MGQKPQVMLVSSVHPWDDTRILFREALTLGSRYEVEVHALAEFKMKYWRGVRIVGLRRRPRWARPIQWMVLGWRAWCSSARIVHFHDPELLFLGIVLTCLGKKAIYDVHEDVYQDILVKEWIPPLLRTSIARFYLLVERMSSRILAGIITATDRNKSYFHRGYVKAVKNYPPVEYFSAVSHPSFTYRNNGILNLIYVGTLNRTRGIIPMIRALEYIPGSLSFHLDIVGGFTEERRFEQDVTSLAGHFEERISFHGRVSYPEAVEFMKKAHIGLVCTQPTVNDMTTLPIKPFEYMAAGLGVVISGFPLWKAYVALYPLHVLVDPTDPEDIARGIVKLAGILPGLDREREQARRKVLSRFNWSRQGSQLLEMYRKILSGETTG